ncbi:MAG: hypothetical protein EXQ71_06025 [Acidimicrobiia bacterium]|nr:hypothetical protein [Acidimicrobiia bacterium]
MTSEAADNRILDYFRACVEAEHAASQYRILGSKGVLLLESGSAPLEDGVVMLSKANQARHWAGARQSAGSNEVLFAGWPVVRSRRKENGKYTDVAAALLFTEVALTRAGADDFCLAPTSRAVELDDAALGLLGMSADEREQLLRDYASAIRPGSAGPLSQAIQFLRKAKILEGEHDASALAKFDGAATMSNSAIAWAGDADQSAFTRVLVEDLDALRKKAPAEVLAGPLGILLGQPADPDGQIHPTPAVLPTTLEQERAICSAQRSRLTVVTGPPGTGKSQVLANTVAAALAAGESVLLASKNNHAIDVVHDRVAGMHPGAVPIRAGKRSFRAEAAQAMGAAMSKQQADSSGLATARQQWERVLRLVEEPYRQIAERAQVQIEVESQRVAVEHCRRGLPTDLSVDPLLVDADSLAASVGLARRRLREYGALPQRWFWQKKRKRTAERELDEAVATVATLADTGAKVAFHRAVTERPEAVIDLGAAIVELLTRLGQLQQAETRLALLPDTALADQAISDSFATRQPAAADVFGATWRELLRPMAPARAHARQYQAGLASRAESGSGIGPLKSQLPATLAVFPVWSVTSLAAGGWFPLTPGLFDLVIIDEASQSDIASALPLLFRAKRAMIVGDPNQLTHIANLGASADAHLAKKHGLDEHEHGRYSYRDTSLYGLAASRLNGEPVFLNRHFRSHPDVIGFSNEVFYGDRLRVETNPDRFLPGPAFQWHDVEGRFEPGPGGRSAKNFPEAEAVLELLGVLLDELSGTDKTVGIVTPFAPQRDLLRELKDDRFEEQVTIDTAHGFQGDERDVMIFSPTVTKGVPPGVARFAGNPNLLNVALTRARARTIVVGDQAFARESETLLSRLVSYADRVASAG